MVNEKINQFPITVYGKSEKYSETISKQRCRVFYKGRNRNGAFITDDFAEKLIATAPYAPVKGIYDNVDYTDHGETRDQGRIYGVVPDNPNFAWEKHLDDDGIEREYACFDVLLYTALYAEASEIMGKGQSMELYKPSIKGNWQFIQGKRSFVYSDGCFLGLQVLGDDVEPCFEGAAFFSLCQTLDEQNNNATEFSQDNGEGGIPMLNFKISDGQKHEALWTLLNPNYCEEGNWIVEYSICEVYDEYALVRNHADCTYERVYYKKDDEHDSIEITNKEICHIVDISESEMSALKALRAVNGDTYEKVDEVFNNLKEENLNLNTKVEELNSDIATLTTERDNVAQELETANSNYTVATENLVAANNTIAETNSALEGIRTELATLTSERDALAAFKKDVEDNEKRNIINGYTEQLPETVITTYTNEMDKYTAEELDMKLTYELKKVNPTIFSKNPTPAQILIPQVIDNGATSWDTILGKYKKN